MNDETQATPAEADLERRVAPQRLVGRYEVGELIGRGGVGQVHEATDLRTGSRVAVKFVRPSRNFAIRQVRRELTALRALALPGVVRLLDDGMSGGQYFLVMSLVVGLQLDEALRDVPWSRGAPLIRALLATLGRVHLAGVVHRDLKPSNIRVTQEGRPVLIDFGLAWGGAVARVGGSTREGSPGFAAPEQWRGEPGDERTDLYACGRILRDWIATCGAPSSLRDVVGRMLSENPEDRPGSALEVLEAFGGDRAAVRGRVPELSDPASVQELRGLFGGPRRCFFHLDEDAASVLFSRTKGVAGQVEQVLAGWVDRGEARWNGDHFSMDRGTLDRLACAGEAEPGVANTPERLRERARKARASGRLAVAWAILEPATLAGREEPACEQALVFDLVVLALELEQPPILELALQVCERSGLDDWIRTDCVRLLQGARAALGGEAERARTLLDGICFDHEMLERLRLGCLVRAASQQSIDKHRACVERLSGLAPPADHLGWRGGLSYREGCWSESARWYEQSLACRTLPHRRLAARLNAGQAFLEALDFARAHAHARQAVEEASQLRHADFEARAAWVLRASAYRRGDQLAPRFDLVDAAFSVGVRRGAMHAMTEAAIAWRCEHRGAGALATRAAQGFRECGLGVGELLAQSLHAAAEGVECTEADVVCTRILASGVPEIALQAAALWPGVSLPSSEIRHLASSRPRREWSVRLDVLSIEEAVGRCSSV